MPHNLSWPFAPGLKVLRLPVSSYLLRTASGPAQSSMNLRPHHTGLPARLLRIARTRGKSFLPGGLQPFQRRAEEVAIRIRAAFLRGISTRQVGRVVATLSGETVSAQTVSKLTRDLDQAVRQFHAARLADN